MTGVLGEAFELVEHGRLGAEEFRAFTCDNPIRLHATMNAGFFDGTPVEDHARHLVADRPGGPR
jgi:hypothetical protein